MLTFLAISVLSAGAGALAVFLVRLVTSKLQERRKKALERHCEPDGAMELAPLELAKQGEELSRSKWTEDEWHRALEALRQEEETGVEEHYLDWLSRTQGKGKQEG